MATAKLLPSGNYRIRVYTGKDANGKPQYKSITCSSKKEAERQAALYDAEQEQAEENGMTIGEAISQYIQNNTNVLSPASIRKYESMRKNNFSSIEGRYVRKMKQADYQAFVNELCLDHAPKTVSSICGLLTAALHSIGKGAGIDLKKPQIRKSGMSIPTDKQVKQLIAAAGRPEMELAFILGASLGLRRSEICALSWADIDGNILHIRKAMVQDKKNQWVIKATKTNAGTRDIDVPDYILSRFNALKTPENKPADMIFPFTPSAITMRFYKVSKNIGINCRFHDLRHYNASVMLALGVPDKYAMQRMGHATPNMLKNVYQHLIDEKEKEVAKKVNGYMKKIAK